MMSALMLLGAGDLSSGQERQNQRALGRQTSCRNIAATCCLYRFMQQCQLSTGLVEFTYLQSSKAAAAPNTPSAAD